MKKIIIMLAALVVGCSTNIEYKQSGVVIEGSTVYEVCMPNGVIYYTTGTYTLTPKFNKDSKVEVCSPQKIWSK